jgi:hypothetical protein
VDSSSPLTFPLSGLSIELSIASKLPTRACSRANPAFASVKREAESKETAIQPLSGGSVPTAPCNGQSTLTTSRRSSGTRSDLPRTLHIEPDFRVETIKPISIPSAEGLGQPGQMTRILLSILRQAAEPLTSGEQ